MKIISCLIIHKFLIFSTKLKKKINKSNTNIHLKINTLGTENKVIDERRKYSQHMGGKVCARARSLCQ